MGYVEDIQKINKLAKELLQHGIVDSLDQACLKAKEMLSKQDGQAVINNTDIPKDNNTNQSSECQEMTWQKAMSKNNEYIVKMLKEFQQQLSSIISDVQDLRKQTQRSILNPVQQPDQITIEPNENSNFKQKTSAVSRNKEEESHPKQGGFNTEDVAIEKMFYFGNK